ncbi:MAG: hypothetical protein HY520_04760, partial [Candidatus Aenigmarchaeota archaeon]|nr:hypothetical protein [Candidatus Aenigmarchaeota archaeon]
GPTPAALDSKFTVEIEKMKTLLDAQKDAKAALDQKLLTISEGMGELRSLVYQREAIAKNQDLKVEKLGEQMAELKPEQMAKEFAKRDKSITDHDMRLEKIEFKLGDLLKTVTDIRSLLKSVGGLENIAAVNKEIAQKTASLEEKAKRVDRLSSKIEGMYVDLNKKMEDFFLYRAKQETLDELVKELMKASDNLGARLSDYVAKPDLAAIREDISGIGSRMREMKKLIDTVIPIVRLKLPARLQELQKGKDDIELVIATLEESHRKGTLAKQEFLEAKRKNQEKLAGVARALEEEWARFEAQQSLGEPPAAAPQMSAPPSLPQQAEISTPAQEASLAPPAGKPAPAAAAPAEKPQGGGPPAAAGDSLLAELRDSLAKGQISKDAYERAVRALGRR